MNLNFYRAVLCITLILSFCLAGKSQTPLKSKPVPPGTFVGVGDECYYPTQAKVRLEWGTHLLLPVHRKFEVVTTQQLSHLPCISNKRWVPHSSRTLA
jgi:hypothetical protein